MRSNLSKLTQFLRYCTVGVANTAVDVILFFLLTLFGMAVLPAQVLSYSAGIVNSFLLNRTWTFRVAHGTTWGEVMKFLIVNGLTLGISYGLLVLFQDVYHLSLWKSKGIATLIGMGVNFIGSRLWVFTPHQHTRKELS